jgi:hypothetical protein
MNKIPCQYKAIERISISIRKGSLISDSEYLGLSKDERKKVKKLKFIEVKYKL